MPKIFVVLDHNFLPIGVRLTEQEAIDSLTKRIQEDIRESKDHLPEEADQLRVSKADQLRMGESGELQWSGVRRVRVRWYIGTNEHPYAERDILVFDTGAPLIDE